MGSIVEQSAARKYQLQTAGNHRSHRDAVDVQGREVEIKSALKERGSGYPGYFQIHKRKHEKLCEKRGGSYVFGVYDDDVERVVELRRIPASKVSKMLKQHTANRGHCNLRWDYVWAYEGYI